MPKPDFRPQSLSDTEGEEKSYRRGFDQGVAAVLYALGLDGDVVSQLHFKQRSAEFREGIQKYPPWNASATEQQEIVEAVLTSSTVRQVASDRDPGPLSIESPVQINKSEALSLVKGIAKSESLRSQLPSFIDEQLELGRYIKRFSATVNFNNPNINTADETKKEIGNICGEMIVFLERLQQRVGGSGE